jgi:dihydroorotate dehydrogenase electron transfer subunit
VTDLLPGALEESAARNQEPGTGNRKPETGNPVQLYACGPEPMLDAVTRFARARNLPAQLSLDRRMGCGLGACGACVCKVQAAQAPDGWDYIRICRDGPVVDAARLATG